MGTNAQDRANGGAPAALSLVRIDNGSLSIVRTVAASDLTGADHTAPSSLASLPPFTTSNSLSAVERSPDFPATAADLAAAWTARYSDRVDAVVSLDTTGLGYLAAAAGPVAIGDGDSIPAADIAGYLAGGASGASPALLDARQSTALADVLGNIIAGKGTTAGYLSSAAHLVNEKRLFIWSADSKLQSFIATSPVAGTLSSSNAAVTSWGLYFNDPSTAAVSTYLTTKAALSVSGCSAPGHESSVLTVSLSSSLKTAALTEDVIVYGPLGFHYSGFTLTGATLLDKHFATIDNHPVEAYRVKLLASAPATLTVRHLEGGVTPSSTVELRSSPRWQATGVTLAPCS
jgi:hypothetical protein